MFDTLRRMKTETYGSSDKHGSLTLNSGYKASMTQWLKYRKWGQNEWVQDHTP